MPFPCLFCCVFMYTVGLELSQEHTSPALEGDKEPVLECATRR